MEIDSVEFIFQTFILLALYVTAPILITTFVAAIFIGIVQAMMQIQEQTLSFMPKLLIVIVLLLLTSSAIFEKIVETITDVINMAPEIF